MEKLYQQDPFLTRFTAQVVSCADDKGGWSVVLDRTASVSYTHLTLPTICSV